MLARTPVEPRGASATPGPPPADWASWAAWADWSSWADWASWAAWSSWASSWGQWLWFAVAGALLNVAHLLHSAVIAVLTPVYIHGPTTLWMRGGVPVPELCAALSPGTDSAFWVLSAESVDACAAMVRTQVQRIAIGLYIAAACVAAWRLVALWERRSMVRAVADAVDRMRLLPLSPVRRRVSERVPDK